MSGVVGVNPREVEAENKDRNKREDKRKEINYIVYEDNAERKEKK